jgi:hypothetical protein
MPSSGGEPRAGLVTHSPRCYFYSTSILKALVRSWGVSSGGDLDYLRGSGPPLAGLWRRRSGGPGIFFVGTSFYTVGYVT